MELLDVASWRASHAARSVVARRTLTPHRSLVRQLYETWMDPSYAQYVIYPHALCFLELLQDPTFRTQSSQAQFKEAVHSAQFFEWAYARAHALKESETRDERE